MTIKSQRLSLIEYSLDLAHANKWVDYQVVSDLIQLLDFSHSRGRQEVTLTPMTDPKTETVIEALNAAGVGYAVEPYRLAEYITITPPTVWG